MVTGRLEARSRAETQALIKVLGGSATSSVSGRTDYLGAGADPGSKLDAARRHNVGILNDEAFHARIGGALAR